MNKIYTALAAIALSAFAAEAKTAPVSDLPFGAVTDASVEHSANKLIISMNIHPDAFSTRSNREVTLFPRLVSGDSVLSLPQVIVAGRTRWYQHKRAEEKSPLLRAGDRRPYTYTINIDRKSWMDCGRVMVMTEVAGCCGASLAPAADSMVVAFNFAQPEAVPVYLYVKPVAEIEKSRSLSGSAFIDYPVNKTTIYPDYRSNPQELAKILKTIDDVRKNPDVTVKSITFKGYASPEGPYDNNERLARERTRSLQAYVESQYNFPANLIHSEWEAEDWAGLIEWLRKSGWPDRDALIEICTTPIFNGNPDGREWRLKSTYPQQYRILLADVYPALRHCDYHIDYVVRNYTEVGEIAEVLRTAPGQLSQNELYTYAQTLDESSPEFQEVMEVAVRLFPGDPVANLNAASTAVKHGEYDKARAYLQKAGDSPEAVYILALIELRQGNKDAARDLLKKASEQGVKLADDLLEQMEHKSSPNC